MKDFYAILGIERNATPEQIREAYIALSKSLHPDVNPAGAGLMRAVNDAYDTLKDPEKKRQYDLSLKVKAFVPPVRSRMQADGSVNLLTLVGAFVPPEVLNAAAPVMERKLAEHGITAKAATAEQVFEAFGLLKKKRRTRRAG